MQIPFEFFNSGEAAESYCALVTRIYQAAAYQARAAPSAESIFPSLCRFATEHGLADPMSFRSSDGRDMDYQIAKLCSCVRFLFKKFPTLAVSIIESDAVVQDAPVQATRNPERIVGESSPLYCERNASGKIVAPLGSEKHTKKLSAYQVEQALCKSESIRVIGEALYVYADGYYQHITGECMRRLIMRDCRSAVEAAGTTKLIDEIYKFLLCDPDLFHQEESLDSELIAFDNGVLDLRSGRLFPLSPDYEVFYRLNTWWGCKSNHPTFDKFLGDICGGDPYLQNRILEVIGYCLVPDMRKKYFFVFQGMPDSGKSVLAKFIRACINPDACTALDVSTLGERFVAANLVGKQLCLSMDIPATPLSAKTVSTFKTMTGGDPITADVKYSPHITFFNRARFILGTNHPLLIQGEDPAFFKRAIAIPFLHGTPPEKQDAHLLERLNNERAAVVFDAIQAYRKLRDRNYEFSGSYPINASVWNQIGTPLSVDEMVLEFVRNQCIKAPESITFLDDLHNRFSECYPGAAIRVNHFGERILAACQALGISNVHRGTKRRKARGQNPQATLVGLTLKEE